MTTVTKKFNDGVRSYWEQEPCGTSKSIVGGLQEGTLEWFERVEEYRYSIEPFIHSIAQFTRHHGQKILEVGVGAGTDHLQWARAGAKCHGVDLTDAAIKTTKKRLTLYGFESNLQRVDAEVLPFPDGTFDLVYSWGVIHHSEDPPAIVKEVRRVLKPGGVFIGMVYHRHSVAALKHWVRSGLLKGKPWKSLADVVWDHQQTFGTKAYTSAELKQVFSEFNHAEVKALIAAADRGRWTAWFNRAYPNRWGWFLTFKATK